MRGNDLESFCGTNGGHQSHKRRGEQPCDECLRAHARYRRALRASQAPPHRSTRRTNR